jgi:hypothetical protein
VRFKVHHPIEIFPDRPTREQIEMFFIFHQHSLFAGKKRIGGLFCLLFVLLPPAPLLLAKY